MRRTGKPLGITGKIGNMTKQRNKFIARAEAFKVAFIKDIQDHLLKMAPKALALKDEILSDPKQSIWLRSNTASDVLDRVAPRPSQNVNIRGAIVTAQYSDEELKEILMNRMIGEINKGDKSDP